jgi:hypothetical protein
MFIQYELVSYGLQNMICCWRIFTPIYSLTLIALAISLLAIELPQTAAFSATAWASMTSNQKSFFENSVANLESERK